MKLQMVVDWLQEALATPARAGGRIAAAAGKAPAVSLYGYFVHWSFGLFPRQRVSMSAAWMTMRDNQATVLGCLGLVADVLTR